MVGRARSSEVGGAQACGSERACCDLPHAAPLHLLNGGGGVGSSANCYYWAYAQHHSRLLLLPLPLSYRRRGGGPPKVSIRRSSPPSFFLPKFTGSGVVSFYPSPGYFGATPYTDRPAPGGEGSPSPSATFSPQEGRPGYGRALAGRWVPILGKGSCSTVEAPHPPQNCFRKIR